MKMAVYSGKRFIEEVVDSEFIESHHNKEKANQIVNAVRLYGTYSLPIRGTFEYLTFKKVNESNGN